jgi:putative ABC transport system permease protein
MHTTPETYSNIIAVKINTDDYSQVTGYIEEKWNAFVPTRPFEYTFLNEQLNALYIDEERFGRISIMLTLLAIFIAILGLTGLTSFLTRQRRKEICIRRVHGATMSNILWFMLKDYVGLFIMANLISWPVTYLIMNNWLLRYSSSIHIGLWVFLLSAFITVLITLVIIGYQTFRITSFNPAHELRYE